MAQAKEIPPLASPIYGRIMSLVQCAHGGIRSVRASINVQAPFIYVQLLASLVHLNNIVNAISFGVTLGACTGTLLQRYKMHQHVHGDAMGASSREAYTDITNLAVSFFLSIFGPFIYHALLEVAICIAQPFDNEDGKIPTERLLTHLEKDLVDGKKFSQCDLPWKKPCFYKLA